MNRSFSIYLDLVRFVAAALVYLWHSNHISPGPVLAGGYGQSAVIAFFVLSGFVIAYVVETKERDWRRYLAGRGARVYSVVVPIIVLTLLMDALGRQLDPETYRLYPFDQLLARIVASLFMLNEIGPISVTFLSNIPFWSIAYEWWYYILFGLATFTPGRWRWPTVIGAGLLIGPKVLLLLPIWLSGVVLYRWKYMAQRSAGFYAALLVLSTLGIVAFHQASYPSFPGQWLRDVVGSYWFRELAFSKNFLSDYVLCALVWMNFAGMRFFAPLLAPVLHPLEKPIRAAASCTFTLYLLHQPAMLFWNAVLHTQEPGWPKWWLVTTLMAVTVAVVGHLTEQRRDHLRAMLQRLLEWRLPRPARPV